MKKLILIIFFMLIQVIRAQNEFVTIWKPSNTAITTISGTPSNLNEIWFPGRGTNFNVEWEEIGFLAHSGSMTNVTAVKQFLINFGTPLNPNPSNATYKVKISNGNGNFNAVKFPDQIAISPALGIPIIPSFSGDRYKILEVVQWGNIEWESMEGAFASCPNLNITATDIPNLSNVTTTSLMFFECNALIGNPTFNTWNTSSITNMSHMFASAGDFNQPVGNWNVSNVTNMTWMFHYLSKFHQPLDNWNVSNVTSMDHMFHRCYKFNQSLNNWNTANVVSTKSMLEETTEFNQNIGNWDLNSLTNATSMVHDSGIDCENYNSILIGWANNINTPTAINLGVTSPLQYSSLNATNARNFLVNTKSWSFSGDVFNPECSSELGTSESNSQGEVFVYPNPATDYINIRNFKALKAYSILDFSGRMIQSNGNFSDNRIEIISLKRGNYILQIITKDKIHSFKFIKR